MVTEAYAIVMRSFRYTTGLTAGSRPYWAGRDKSEHRLGAQKNKVSLDAV